MSTDDRHYLKYTFLKVSPRWLRRSAKRRAADKREILAALGDFAADHYLRTYSLIGLRADADLLIRCASRRLQDIHELHVLLQQAGLMRDARIAHSLLAVTKESPYSAEPRPLHPREAADQRFLVVYPMWKRRDWYRLDAAERGRVMREHIDVARQFASVETNTAYSFGIDDQEFVVAFDVDEPADFVDLVQALRATESSVFTQSETPIFTCLAASPRRALDRDGPWRP
jgi:chlorite dismutase